MAETEIPDTAEVWLALGSGLSWGPEQKCGEKELVFPEAIPKERSAMSSYLNKGVSSCR